MSHTPGPWTLVLERPTYAGGEPVGFYVCGAKGGRIGQVFENCLVKTTAEAETNARLIAAAPELLHAVYVAHGTFARQLGADGMGPDWWGDDEHEAFTVLKAVIAKAEGK